MLTKIIRAADKALRNSVLLRAAAVIHLHLTAATLCGGLFAEGAFYIWPGGRHFYAPCVIAVAFIYFIAALLWRKPLVCDAETTPRDVNGHEQFPPDAIARAMTDPRNTKRWLFDKILVGACLGVLPGALCWAAAKALFALSDLQALLLAGVPGYLLYIAVTVLTINHTLQGARKFRWKAAP